MKGSPQLGMSMANITLMNHVAAPSIAAERAKAFTDSCISPPSCLVSPNRFAILPRG